MASDSVVLIAQLGGELITYTPYGGTPKSFKALVERHPMRVAPGGQGVGGEGRRQNALELWIPNDATDGVTSIKEREDRVSFKLNLDDAEAREFYVAKVLEQDIGLSGSDSGMFHVEVIA